MQAYERAYEQPFSVSIQQSLWSAILGFEDFEHFHELGEACLAFPRPDDIRTTKLHTNGSTGNPRPYFFPQNFYIWRANVESFLRGAEINPHIILYERPYLPRNYVEFHKDGDRTIVNLSLEDREQARLVAQFVKEQSMLYGPVVLVSTPNVWLHISTTPDLRDLFNDLNILHGTNTDWDLFGRLDLLRFPVRDQMIDWHTGLNFYVCGHGFRHFLPIFYQQNGYCKNLLNVASGLVACEDQLEISEKIVNCPCGKRRADFSYTPHKSNYLELDRSILESMTGSYQNLQFIERDGIHIYWVAYPDAHDEEFLRERFPEAHFHPQQSCRIGAKVYNFWKTGTSLWIESPFKSFVNLNKAKNIRML